MCSDPEHAWYPQRTVCFADMQSAAANRRYDELHEAKPYHDGTFKTWSEKPVNSYGELTHPFHYRDGVSIWASPVDLAPDDDFLSAPKRGGEHGDEARAGHHRP